MTRLSSSFERDRELIIVEAEVVGPARSMEARLVLDTGAAATTLTPTWDALCDGKYDWAHLAMHLWPERGVPKCATDRSFAIAHRLEEMFWVEGSDGRWSARKAPTRPIDELVEERTSPAAKAALKSLLEAPVAAGGTKKARKGKKHA